MDTGNNNYDFQNNYNRPSGGGKGKVIAIVAIAAVIVAAAIAVVLILRGTSSRNVNTASARTTTSRSSSSRSSGSGSLRSRVVRDREEEDPARPEEPEEEEVPANPYEEIAGYYIATAMGYNGIVIEGEDFDLDIRFAFEPDGTGWSADTLEGEEKCRELSWSPDGTYETADNVRKAFTYTDGVITVVEEGLGYIELTRQSTEIPEKPVTGNLGPGECTIGNLDLDAVIRVSIRVAGETEWPEENLSPRIPEGTMRNFVLADMGPAPGTYDILVEVVEDGTRYVFRDVDLQAGYYIMVISPREGDVAPGMFIMEKVNGEFEAVMAYDAE